MYTSDTTGLVRFVSDLIMTSLQDAIIGKLFDFISRTYLVRSRYWYTIASVCLSSSSSVTLCIVAKRCVLEQKLLLAAYRKSYMRNRLVPK